MESTSKRCWNSFFLPSKYVHRCYFGIILLISNARISIFCFEIEADWFGFRNHVIRILTGATAFARNVDPDHSASLCLSGFVESCCLFTILKFLCWNKHLLAILLISWKVAALRLIYYFKPIMQQNIVQCLCISQTFRIFTFRRRSESLHFADVQNLYVSQTFRIFTFRRRSESLHFADVQNLCISQTFRIFTFRRRSEYLHFAGVQNLYISQTYQAARSAFRFPVFHFKNIFRIIPCRQCVWGAKRFVRKLHSQIILKIKESEALNWNLCHNTMAI